MAAPLENIAAEQEDIPEDVLMMILSKLPPKSLIRFKSVSKSWNTTITHPHLAMLFDDVAKVRDRNTFLIIGAHPDVDTGTESTVTDSLIAAKITFDMKTQASLQVSYDKKYAPLRLRFKYKYAEVLGACSGVICVARESFGEAVLWNPATGEEKWVKVSYPWISTSPEYLRYIGFASVKDEKNNTVDFKLLVEQYKPYQFLVYSLCLNSWRLINPPDFLKYKKVYIRFSPNGVYLHGVLHWLVPTLEYSYILTFDVATESFGKLMLPDKEPDYSFHDLLTLVDDKYLAVVECKRDKGIYLWVMSRYGDMKSWEKRDNMWPWEMVYGQSLGYLHHIGGLLVQEYESNTTYLYLNSEIHKLDQVLPGRLGLVRYRESFVSMKRIAGVT